MTLTFRVSAFFLSTLALVLVAFSLGIFLLARIHLLNQVDARLDSALATLSAISAISGPIVVPSIISNSTPLLIAPIGLIRSWQIREPSRATRSSVSGMKI